MRDGKQWPRVAELNGGVPSKARPKVLISGCLSAVIRLPGGVGLKRIMGLEKEDARFPGTVVLLTCRECDALHRVEALPDAGKALCVRCGAFLYRAVPNALDRLLALYAAALILFVLANAFPFLSLNLGGRVQETGLVSGALALYRAGMGDLGTLVFMTSVLFPLVTIVAMLYLLVPLRLGRRPPGMGPVYRLLRAVGPWSLTGVFMLGVLVAMVKLLDLASVIPGVSLYALAGLLLVSAAAGASFDPSVFWPPAGFISIPHGGGYNALERGLMACHTCALPVPVAGAPARCPRCGGRLHARKQDSLGRTWALVIAAGLLLVPANVYPVMTVIRFGQGQPDTILSGVVHLIEGGMWPLALLVFFASIVVPLVKLAVLVFLLLSVRRGSAWRPLDRTRLFRVTEVVGAWSMVDIFLVALLTALVQMGALASVEPGAGATFFAAVVVLTLLAAHSFDPRLIWDRAGATR